MNVDAQVAELATLSRERLGKKAAAEIERAAREAVRMHEGQVRKSDGGPYVVHCLNVAHACLEWGLHDRVAICGALLHDTIEDADPELKPEEMVRSFGDDVLRLVVALSKIRNLRTGSGDLPATYRRILGAAATDLRVLLIKAFDQYDNAETLFVHPREKAQEKASLGLVYVGVARRLGAFSFANALAARLLPYLMPNRAKQAAKRLEHLVENSRPGMKRLRKRVEEVLGAGLAEGFSLETKEVADFFYLAEKPGTGQLRRVGYPVHRLRLMVPDDDAAWRVLGRMHQLFGPMPRHVRDYMNAPRINGFRALTTRIVWEGYPVSVQVVRHQDAAANRMGVLAKWGESGPDPARYMRLLKTLGDSDLRMSEVHAHVLPDLLDVYSPKGDRYTFPVGAVVLDFAYLVHTELGEHCVGAIVNGNQVGLEEPLNDGDVVEVLTKKKAKPQRTWLEVVKTARARTLIKQSLRKREMPVEGVKRGEGEAFIITDLTGPDLLWSTCCLPVPEEPLLGRLSGDGHWVVHAANCPHAQETGWRPGEWRIKHESDILNVTFTLNHRTGALLQVLELLARRGINGHAIRGKGRTEESFSINMELGGKHPRELGRVLKELPTVGSVQQVTRYFWRT